jgi:hypothetical protein
LLSLHFRFIKIEKKKLKEFFVVYWKDLQVTPTRTHIAVQNVIKTKKIFIKALDTDIAQAYRLYSKIPRI